MKIQITIDNQTSYKTPSMAKIRQVILEVLKKKSFDVKAEINIQIVNKKKIQELNKKYRKLDVPTDVLSFPIYDKPPKKSDQMILLGDTVIYYDIVVQNAKENNISIEDEFLKLIKHSTLHLLGYHHK